MTIQEQLVSLQDRAYADFQSGLVPGIPRETFIGVRVPELRKLARRLRKEEPEMVREFLHTLPHDFYDENILHGILISELRDYGTCMNALEEFLPCIDNWAVCDIISPKILCTNREELLEKICLWAVSEEPYTVRLGLELLMKYYLDGEFREEYLEIPGNVRSEHYYVRMMQAWFFAEALAKQWTAAVPWLESGRLEIWTHNKTIQKARESFRITAEQKEYLRTLRR